MAENSKIEWTDHTFNPWIGCQRVSPGCVNCYAETMNKYRSWVVWGPQGTRRRASDAKWREPVRWNKQAAAEGRRFRVFCASLADVFEDRPELEAWRKDLFRLIEQTPHLDWQLLTKRPENIMRMVDYSWQHEFPSNVWIGTSVENQKYADERIPELLKIPATILFLSCEPLLGPVYLNTVYQDVMDRTHGVGCLNAGINWVIVGGESGPGARPMFDTWARRIIRDCKDAGCEVFVKQLGARPRLVQIDGFHHDTMKLRDKKGGDMAEWPEALRVREMPRVGT